MMNTKRSLLVAGAFALGGLTPSPAHAGNLDWLVFCAGETDDKIMETIENDVAKSCGVKRGDTDLCSVVDGEPWTCSDEVNQPAPQPPPTKNCTYFSISFVLKAGVTLPLGWTYKGEAELKFGWNGAKTSRGTCNAVSKKPKQNGKGGTYVSDAGDILAEVEFKVAGKIVLTSPMGVTVNLEGEGKCERGVTMHYYKPTKVNHCANCSVPLPGGTPTPDPTQPPPTQPPATQPPATQPPATQPPATQPPATQPPKKDPPTLKTTDEVVDDYQCTVEDPEDPPIEPTPLPTEETDVAL